jgi:hypothetical protein
MRQPAKLVVVGLAIAVWGCASTSAERGLALYSGAQAPPEQVATLDGPIATVDGRDVSDKGSLFELRPGCHVITTKTDFVERNVRINIGGIMSHHPRETFVLTMQGGVSYLIMNRTQELDGMSARPWLIARATDPAGVTRDLEPTNDPDAIAACQPSPEKKPGEPGPAEAPAVAPPTATLTPPSP